MDYPTKVVHDFTKNRLCVIPVVLYVHNNIQSDVAVHFLANANNGWVTWNFYKIVRIFSSYSSIRKPTGAATQLYMPEAASPFLWIGRIQGDAHLSAEKPSEAIELAVAVSRPGAFSLARGLQIVAETAGYEAAVQCSKLEFTLVVENKES